jgi:hypothetical protein
MLRLLTLNCGICFIHPAGSDGYWGASMILKCPETAAKNVQLWTRLNVLYVCHIFFLVK